MIISLSVLLYTCYVILITRNECTNMSRLILLLLLLSFLLLSLWLLSISHYNCSYFLSNIHAIPFVSLVF